MTGIRLGGALAALALGAVGALAPAPTGAQTPRFTPREIIVIGRAQGSGGSTLSTGSPFAIRDLAALRGVSVREARPLAPGRGGREAFPGGAWVLTLEGDQDPESAAGKLAGDAAVRYAGPNHLLPVGDPEEENEGIRFPETLPATEPDDPNFDDQYGLVLARVPEVWDQTLGEGMLIAIIDTGVQLDHPDLIGQFAMNPAEESGLAGVDDDGNGFVDDLVGWDFSDAPELPGIGDYLERDNDPSDDYSHGTRVAGVVGATANNGIGIAGVAPGARMLPVRAGFRTGLPFLPAVLQEDDAAAAIIYAADRGARILNLSFGATANAPVIGAAVRYARSKGALVVVSAGNTARDEAHYPAACPGVLSVGASDQEDNRTGFSTHGQDMDLMALGVSVYTTDLGGRYRFTAGTSFSAPIVAGSAALLWSLRPDWSADQIAWKLRLSCRRTTDGWSVEEGWGYLDAAAAVRDASPPPILQLESVSVGELGYSLQGTVADPDLDTWTLTGLTEEDAIAGELRNEILIAGARSRQALAESLATFIPPPGLHNWVFRLTATGRGRGLLEERSRFQPGQRNLTTTGLTLENQVGAAGWDLVATWSSTELQQGALRLVAPEAQERLAAEASIATGHGVRLRGPLPAGLTDIRILGRSGDWEIYRELGRREVLIPARLSAVTERAGPDQPPGTPAARVMNWDADNFPEVLVEAPPTSDFYGNVLHYELLANGDAVEIGSSLGLYRGIPVDAADADGDGAMELVVFRVDIWSIWESSNGTRFPNVQLFRESAGISVPLRYVAVGDEVHLLVVAGSTLRALRSDPVEGYVTASEADAAPGRLLTRSAAGDFDADGTLEVMVANDAGSLVVFEVTPSGVAWEQTVPAPVPLSGRMLAIPVQGGGLDLVTVEQDPVTPEGDGDLTRASARLRRWSYNGSTYVPGSSLAFGGLHLGGSFQLLALDEKVVFRRGNRFDVVLTDRNELAWGGTAHTSSLDVEGAALIPVGAPSQDLLWVGTTDGSPGERVFLDPSPSPGSGSALRVLGSLSVSGGVELTLGWERDGCPDPAILERSGTVRGGYSIPVRDRAARDTVSLGEAVTYTLSTLTCPDREARVVGRVTPAPAPSWNAGRLEIDFPVPLERTALGSVIPPRDVQLVRAGATEWPEATHVLRDGNGLAVSPVGPAPDSLVIVGAWDRDGYPVGGSYRYAVAVPEPEAAPRPPVLADVIYRPDLQAIHVEMGGDPPACDARFELEPTGQSWDSPGDWPSFDLVAADLPAGAYVLALRGDCLSDPGSTPGLTAGFTVGVLVYPNPLGPGDELVLENLAPGSRIEILDVSGKLRLRWTPAGVTERRTMDDLSPGLYFLRMVSPEGATLGIQKLAVRR